MKFYWAKRLSVGGALVCLLLMLAFEKAKLLWAFTAMTYFNYVEMKLGVALFESLRTASDKGPVSSILETRLFDAFLIITTALQWFLVGMIIDWLKANRSKGHAGSAVQ